MAHNYQFVLLLRDPQILPVSWKGRSTTAAMSKQEMPLTFFGWVQAWELFTEIRDFAASTGI